MERFIFTLFLCCLFPIIIISHAADSITKTQFITDGNTIVSSGENFELGFFSPITSKNRYVGIWYKKISNGTVVWVANREIPLTDTSGVLKVIEPGILVLLNGTNVTIWSTNTSRSVKNPVVQLLDSGNLVVKDADDDNPENLLWQSFDYLCDTILPGMKLGRNLVTGREWYISSWKSKDDPARGSYRYWMDLRGYPQIFITNGSADLFRVGPWNGLRFSGTPNLRAHLDYAYGMYFEPDAVYSRFDLLNSSLDLRFVMNTTGAGQLWVWSDQSRSWLLYENAITDYCDTYKLCGPFSICNIDNSPVCSCLSKFAPRYPKDWNATDWSNGCVRRTPLSCTKGDEFVKYSGIKLPDTRTSWFYETMELSACQRACFENCSCIAYTNLDLSRSGCLLWFDELVDIRERKENGQDIYIRIGSSELEHSREPGNRRVIIIVTLTIFIGILLLVLSVMLYVRKKKKKNLQLQIGGGNIHNFKHCSPNKNQNIDTELPFFDFGTIANSTNNFSVNNKLGEGGFGPVYKGILMEGREIAVKRLSKNSRQGLDEFKNEVVYIAKLQHRNLVKLLGCCIQAEEMMLIYEYLSNKSLDRFIFDQKFNMLLDWPMRFNIINGIARGLLYLHQDSRLRIVHRDLKAENVLLDDDMNPKISDFGLARSFGGNETEANTNKVVGTYGYISPEYAVQGLYSIKSDVYSFGVLVLEILSGRRNRSFHHPDHHLNLLGHAWQLYIEGTPLELIDASVRDSWNTTEVLRSVNVGLLCVQQHPEDRPSMSNVVLMLSGEGFMPRPKPPGFYTGKSLREAESASNKHVVCSANKVSITQLEGR